MMSKEKKKTYSKADYRRKKTIDVFDNQIHQKLDADVVVVPFDVQWYKGFGYGHAKCVGRVILELRDLGRSSTFFAS